VIATFSRVEVDNNVQKGIGIFTNWGGSILATVVDSVATNNGSNFYALGSSNECRAVGANGCALMQIFRSTSTQSSLSTNIAIVAEGGAQIFVGQSFVGLRGPWSVSTGGQVFSFGDNDAFAPAPSGTIPKF
jgi:hypothetical protein